MLHYTRLERLAMDKHSVFLGLMYNLVLAKNFLIGLYHPLDGVANPKYKLLHFVTTKNTFCKEVKALPFNRDRCCHLGLCL
jgi:hypothetical protein